MDESVLDKLKILAESAKYDVSCASSGTSRGHKAGAIAIAGTTVPTASIAGATISRGQHSR